MDGISLPTCIRCPDLAYNQWARSEHKSGSCVLLVLISEQGVVQQPRPHRLLGYGLDERAFETIKTWTFKPARNQKGDPVAVMVPVEFTFRMD